MRAARATALEALVADARVELVAPASLSEAVIIGAEQRAAPGG